MWNMMYGYGYGYSWGEMWFFMIAFWALAIIGIAVLVRWLASESKGEFGGGNSALRILRERYAKGEIDRKEFEARKKDLEA